MAGVTLPALLRAYLAPQWPRTLLLTVLLLAGIGLQLANPQVVRAFIDAASNGAEVDALIRIGLFFLGVAVATQACAVAETYVAENVGLTATNALRADLTLHCLNLDPRFLNAHTPGELIERIDGDVTTLANFFGRFVVTVLGNALLVLGLLILLTQVDWRVAAALGALLALAVLAMNRLQRIAVPRWEAARAASADLFGFLEERLVSTEDIRASGASAYVLRRFYERSRRLVWSQIKAGTLGVLSLQAGTILLGVGTALALGVGASLYVAGEISLGSVYVIFAYAQLMYRPLEQIQRQMQDLQLAGAGLVRVRQLLGIKSTLVDGLEHLPRGPLEVQVERICFGYVADEPVLRELSFHLQPGEVLGVLGRTGIGKSTLARLLLRLYDPDAGRICLGHTDLRDVSFENLRARIGLVTQDVQLFHATVRDNLSLFDASMDDTRMCEVLGQLELGDWLARLPHGLDTLLAPGGSGLSAGEAQLLAFARVFLRDPGLVILDEASSRLDPATERRIEHAVDRLLEGRTGIIIAHRLATIERVDQVLILDAQGVREAGPRAALEADPNSALAGLLRAGSLELLA